MKESEGRPPLDTALRAMAEDEVQLGASAGVEARLLAEVLSIAAARRRLPILRTLFSPACTTYSFPIRTIE